MKTIGFLVNPRAGIGGKVGLKGSDGEETFEKALALGAEPESGRKALSAIVELKGSDDIQIITYPGPMGEDICREAGVDCQVIGELSQDSCPGTGDESSSGASAAFPHTSPEDTTRAAKMFAESGADLILFAGGDGTARNIMDAVGTDTLVLGIPSGCKIHSGVYAINPRAAGVLAREFAAGRVADSKEAEVMDIDEAQFRQGTVQAQLYGYLKVPTQEGLVQNQKGGSRVSEAEEQLAIAEFVADNWDDETLYVVGTGSTTAAVMKEMELPNTLLGVDLVYGGKVIRSDCTEKEILETIDQYDRVKIIVTVIGGQGYIFGRGNQQLSAQVIRRVGKKNIMIIATRSKIMGLEGNPLLVDTGDEEMNEELTGFLPVIVGYGETMMTRIRG